MAVRLSQKPAKRARVAPKRGPASRMDSVDDLKDGRDQLGRFIAEKRKHPPKVKGKRRGAKRARRGVRRQA